MLHLNDVNNNTDQVNSCNCGQVMRTVVVVVDIVVVVIVVAVAVGGGTPVVSAAVALVAVAGGGVVVIGGGVIVVDVAVDANVVVMAGHSFVVTNVVVKPIWTCCT